MKDEPLPSCGNEPWRGGAGAHPLSSKTTLMTGSQGGRACLSDTQPERERPRLSGAVPTCQAHSGRGAVRLWPPSLLQ